MSRVPRTLRPCTTPRYGSALQARRIVAFHSFLASFLDPSRKPQFRASLGFPPPAQRAHVHTHVLQQANAAESNPPKTTVNQPCADILASLLATRNCRRVSNTLRPNSPRYVLFVPNLRLRPLYLSLFFFSFSLLFPGARQLQTNFCRIPMGVRNYYISRCII